MSFSQYAVKRNEYLKSVNGILFGEDPRQGYVEGNAFYHPTLRFSFPVPTGWEVNNMSAQVQLSSENEDAAIILTVDESSSASQAADEFVQKTSALVQTREPLTVNGFQAQKLVSRVLSEQDTLQVMSYFISKGGKIYAMHGLSGRTTFPQYTNVFTPTLNGFKQLDDPVKINVKPKKLSVRTVGRSATLRAVLKQNAIADDQLENLAIMNGMQLNETVAAGTLIKIPVK